MDYKNYVKKIEVPAGFSAPTQLFCENLVAKPLSRDDLDADMAAVNSSLEIIRKTRGGAWPSEPVTVEFDSLDLAWHEREFRDGSSFAYVIYDDSKQYIGCFYLYGMGHRTELDDELIKYQVDASWWVSSDAYNKGYYRKVQTALHGWLENDFGFSSVYFSNLEQ